mgnify:CR=1 FL=1
MIYIYQKKLKISKNILKIKILRIVNNGVLQHKNVAEKNKIQVLNAISISIFNLTLIVTSVYLLYGFYWQAFLDCIIFSVYYINNDFIKKGRFLLAKFLGLQSIIVFLFLSGLFYNYPITLTHFYLIPVVACLFIFSVKEIHFMIFFIVQLIGLFFVQSIYSADLFHINLNILSQERQDLFNVILLLTLNSYLFCLVFFIVLILQTQEQKLKKVKNRLFLVKKSLRVQNNEMQTFGLAATHSLKTPLFIINSFLNKIENNLTHHEDSHLNGYYFKLLKESNSLNEKYSNDLISYLSIYNVTSDLMFFDLRQLVNQSTEIYQIKYKEARILNDIEHLIIHCNPSLLEIIIQNMVDNALKYNTSEIPTIRIYKKLAKDHISIFFADNGIGIGNDYAEKIFDPFNRINEIETSAGSGLGLTISKLAAFKMNASLDLFYSTKNTGSIFKLHIPNEN